MVGKYSDKRSPVLAHGAFLTIPVSATKGRRSLSGKEHRFHILRIHYEKQFLCGFFLVLPGGDELFGSFDELFGFAPGGVGFASGYGVERLDGVLDAFREFGVFGAVLGEKGLYRGF